MPPDTILTEETTDSQILNDESDDEVIVTDPIEEETEEDVEENKEEEDKKPEDETKKDDEDKPFPYERPSISEIKEKYPNFFKDFPVFRDVVFQEIEYRKTFPTVEDAKDALEDSIALSGLRESVLAGKSEAVLDAIEQTDPKAAEKFATTFLPTLYKKNNELYVQAITPVLEVLVRNLSRSENENQRNAAIVVARHLWGKEGDGVAEGKVTFSRQITESPEEKKLNEERLKFQTEQFTGFQNSVFDDLGKQRKALISRGLDPQKTMTDSQKEMLVERIERLVDAQLAADTSHMSVMNARWLRTKKDGFNTASKEKIISAYLSRAKQLIPSIREKEKNAFFGTRKKASEKKIEEIDKKSSTEKAVTSGRVSNSNGNNQLPKGRELYRKMSDLDILNS